MILAQKITKLRKQLGLSQEELAEKLEISRQSVSKWESTTSIPDLNKIIRLSELFGVTTDFLLKDDMELIDYTGEDKESGVLSISIEDTTNYIKTKVWLAKNISIGVLISILSIVPFLFLSALSEAEKGYLSEELAEGIGLTSLFVFITIAVIFFLRKSPQSLFIDELEKSNFDLSYGVRGIIVEKLQRFQGIYTKTLSLCTAMFIISVVPLFVSSLYTESDMILFLMLILMLVIVGVSLFILIPKVTENNCYNFLLGEGDFSKDRKLEIERDEKFAGFYWPLVTAGYIGWSLWTMEWGITWIIWPIAGIAFVGFTGLIRLLETKK
ncbi:XRE family transcriptional regulator [Thiospirochaeta perfilievii]|uniref:XRE family transcriptional regulator n=1 Tax=Thiospirochaeta perfilievii TaxID=252967 RepID=A0A5C1Q8Y5_9SPIO|nr:helix-turn-helix transcriptional regulator [Thiospirochaeta perfilievii]QEN03897.1 XRE family transcriptional regulator [Thiospirochaeta perfilievii]